MKILICSYSESEGGAARAAFKHFRALTHYGIDAELWTSDKKFNFKGCYYQASSFKKFINFTKRSIALFLTSIFSVDDGYKSLNLFSALNINEINCSKFDLVHLHWIGGELISISDIGKIRKPLLWTLHDMWPFMGIEHYKSGNNNRWFINQDPLNVKKSLFDLDEWAWRQKKRFLNKSIHLIASSKWMQDNIRSSKLMHSWNIDLIPNLIDESFYAPTDTESIRLRLNISKEKRILLFGAAGGLLDNRKGGDLFLKVVNIISKTIPNIHIIIFGGGDDDLLKNLTTPITYSFLGPIKNDNELVQLYSLADILIVPSRQDNLPLLAVEAQMSGCPIIAFDISGLRDIVLDANTGYLIKPFDIDQMAKKTCQLLMDLKNLQDFKRNARINALKKWSFAAVLPKYDSLYKSLTLKPN